MGKNSWRAAVIAMHLPKTLRIAAEGCRACDASGYGC